jgi:hypothetical protein
MSQYDTGQTDPADDIETALAAAAAVAVNAGRAQLIMDSRQRYSIARAPRAGANGQLAQIRLPYSQIALGTPGQQTWVEMVGIPGGDTVSASVGGAAKTGTVIESTLASASSPAYASTTGIASMIGGPASYSSLNTTTGKFSGIAPHLRNIALVQPANPPLAGLDLGWCFCAKLDEVTVTTPEFLNWNGGFNFTPASKLHAVGIQLPFFNCNPPVRVGSALVAGYIVGYGLGECLDAGTLVAQWCIGAVAVDAAYHPNWIDRLYDINCVLGFSAYHPQNSPSSVFGYPATTGHGSGRAATYASPVVIGQWSIQWNNGQSTGFDRAADVYDNANVMPIAAVYSVVNAGSGSVTTAVTGAPSWTGARATLTKLFK